MSASAPAAYPRVPRHADVFRTNGVLRARLPREPALPARVLRAAAPVLRGGGDARARPAAVRGTVRTRENDTVYVPLPQTHNESGLGRAVQVRLPSPLRLLEPLDGVLFAATTSRVAQPDGRHPDGSPCLFVGTLQEFGAAQRETLPGQRYPGLLTSYARPGRRFCRAGDVEVACVDGASVRKLRA